MKTEFYFDDVISRVKKALKIKADYELANRINMKPTAFNSRKKANSLPFEELLVLANSEKLDFNWVLTGEGEMYRIGPKINSVSEERAEKFIELFDTLNETQQKEILAACAEKKRMNELEQKVDQLEKKVG